CRAENGAANGRHVTRRGWVFGPEATVAGRREDVHVRMVEVRLQKLFFAEFGIAPAVADECGPGCGRRLGRQQVAPTITVGFDQENIAPGASGRGHLNVEVYLSADEAERRRWQRAWVSVLVDLLEAA